MRRIGILLIVMAAFAAPLIADALPRPPGTQTQSQSEEEVANIPLSAMIGPLPVQSPILAYGRNYRIQFSGIWNYGANACQWADPVFTTTNGCTFTQGSRGSGQSVVVDGVLQSTNPSWSSQPCTGLGQPYSYCTGNHAYSFLVTGTGARMSAYIWDTNYTDNGGGLIWKIFLTKQVTYTAILAERTVPVGTPGVPVGYIQVRREPPFTCVVPRIHLVGDLAKICVPDQDGRIPVTTVPLDIPAIPANSSVMVEMLWTADLQMLVLTGRDTFFGTGGELWAPFPANADGLAWFQANRDAVGATFAVVVDPPGGSPTRREVIIPGLGQFLEAAHHSRLNVTG